MTGVPAVREIEGEGGRPVGYSQAFKKDRPTLFGMIDSCMIVPRILGSFGS